MKRRGWLVLGAVLSGALLAWTLRGLHLEELGRILRGLRVEWVVGGALFYFTAVALRTWRWGVLLRGVQPTRFGERFVALANNLYPARAGELLRAYVLQRRSGVSAGAALGTIVVERVLDGWMVLLLALVALLFSPLPGSLRPAVIAGGLVFGGAMLALAAIAAQATAIRSWLDDAARWWPHRWIKGMVGILLRFVEGLAVLRRPTDTLAAGALTALIWLAEAATYGLVLMAFPFQTSFFALLAMTAAVNLATALPSAPGYIGTFEAPGVAVLRAFGIPGGMAIAYVLVLHMALWLPITLVGLWLLLREGLRGIPARVMNPSEGIQG